MTAVSELEAHMGIDFIEEDNGQSCWSLLVGR